MKPSRASTFDSTGSQVVALIVTIYAIWVGYAVYRRQSQTGDLGEWIWSHVLRPLGRLRLNVLRLVPGWGGTSVLYMGVDRGEARLVRELPPKPSGSVRVVCVSDTHLQHHELRLPPGDVLLHGGDLLLQSRATNATSLSQLCDAALWFSGQPYAHKVVVAGNHDGALASLGKEGTQKMLPGVTYLQDGEVEVMGLRIHGSPLSVGQSKNAAFQPQSGYDEDAATAAIPEGLDILLTHGPPGSSGKALGRASAKLDTRVREVKPRYHIFGHWHLGFGITHDEGHATCFVNASSADALFAVTNPPIVLDIQPRKR